MAQRGYLTDEAYQLVLQRLRDGDYASGQRISVEDLVLELGASRQPVMDALKRLSTEGFLDIIPQVGVQVVDPERDDFIDFFTCSPTSRVFAPGWRLSGRMPMRQHS